MGDDQDAHVGAGKLVDALGDGAQRVDVEPRVGLVEHGDLGLQHRQLQQLHPLLLSAGEAFVEVTAGEVFGDVRQRHRLLGDLGEVFDLDLGFAAGLAVGVEDHPQVLADRDAGDRDRVLKGHEEAGARALVGIGLGDVLALEGDRALRHLEGRVAHDRVGEGRLAGPVRAPSARGPCPSRRRGRGRGGSPCPRRSRAGCGSQAQPIRTPFLVRRSFSRRPRRRAAEPRARAGRRTRPARPASSRRAPW